MTNQTIKLVAGLIGGFYYIMCTGKRVPEKQVKRLRNGAK